jgi:hypothetical protein
MISSEIDPTQSAVRIRPWRDPNPIVGVASKSE